MKMLEELVLPLGNRAVSHGGESPALGVFETNSEGMEAGCPTFSIDVGWGLRGVTVWTFLGIIFCRAYEAFAAIVPVSVRFPVHAVGGSDDLSGRAWLLGA